MITILTPTYNRGYILHKAYQSLREQTSYDFEWIIVDDGSSDNTEFLVNSWRRECSLFPIIYHKQANGGKHRAVNKGVSISKGAYVLILDSDDYLEPNAIELIKTWIFSIKDDPSFAGIAGLKAYEYKDEIIGNYNDKEYIDATNLERKKYNLTGDKAEVYKIEILKKYPFPEFEGENFLRESASWDRIAMDGYKIRWFNSVIYRCEYLSDGLTKNANDQLYAKNFKGFTYCTKLHIETLPLLTKYFKIGYFIKVAKIKKLSTGQIKKLLEVNFIQLLFGDIIYKINRLIKKGKTK